MIGYLLAAIFITISLSIPFFAFKGKVDEITLEDDEI